LYKVQRRKKKQRRGGKKFYIVGGGSTGFGSGDLEPCDGAGGAAKESEEVMGSAIVEMEGVKIPEARRAR
jgi:hypothetical protein